MKTTLDRLVRSQYLKRIASSQAWNCGGTSYVVARFVANRLALESQRGSGINEADSGTKVRLDSGTKGVLERSSSSNSSLDLTSTTTATSELDDHQLADRFDEDLRTAGVTLLGANDAMQLWRTGKYTEHHHVTQSILHMDHYIASGQAKNVGNPKAFGMRELLKGYFGRPAGFKSTEEKAEEALLAAEEQKAQNLRIMRRRRMEANFVSWEAELPDHERAQIIDESTEGGGQFVTARMVSGILREEYAKRFHTPELLEEDPPAAEV